MVYIENNIYFIKRCHSFFVKYIQYKKIYDLWGKTKSCLSLIDINVCGWTIITSEHLLHHSLDILIILIFWCITFEFLKLSVTNVTEVQRLTSKGVIDSPKWSLCECVRAFRKLGWSIVRGDGHRSQLCNLASELGVPEHKSMSISQN